MGSILYCEWQTTQLQTSNTPLENDKQCYELTSGLIDECCWIYIYQIPCGSKENQTPTALSNIFKKYWSIWIIFGGQNLQRVSNVHIYNFRILIKQDTSLDHFHSSHFTHGHTTTANTALAQRRCVFIHRVAVMQYRRIWYIGFCILADMQYALCTAKIC